jgi:hypothetical protein
LDQDVFRSYFKKDMAPGMSRWDAVANGVNEYWLKEFATEMEILRNNFSLPWPLSNLAMRGTITR